MKFSRGAYVSRWELKFSFLTRFLETSFTLVSRFSWKRECQKAAVRARARVEHFSQVAERPRVSCQTLTYMVEMQRQMEHEWSFWSWQSHLLSVSTNLNLRIAFVILRLFCCSISILIYLLCWLDIYSKCRTVSETRKILISSWYLLIPGCLSLVTLQLSHIVCRPIDCALN